MTATARKVLADSRTVHDLLETESDAARFRVLWVSGVALLRSVGHVLQKVDSKHSPMVAKAIDDAWKRWKADGEANAIFFEFIEEGRNNILKEYEFGFLSGPVEVLVTPSDRLFTLEDNLYCPVSGGRFDGEDCRDVMAEAIAWWERELSLIDLCQGD
jgi:hypothetical protein